MIHSVYSHNEPLVWFSEEVDPEVGLHVSVNPARIYGQSGKWSPPIAYLRVPACHILSCQATASPVSSLTWWRVSAR